MFKDNYKKEMDSIKPSQDTIEKILTLNTAPKRANRRILKISIACILASALICTFTIGAFMLSDDDNKTTNDSDVSNDHFAANDADAPVKLTGIRKAKSYSELKSALKDCEDKRYPGTDFVIDEFEDSLGNATDGTVDVPESVEPSIDSDSDHSDTNNQVLGVQESDIVKNDGEYIYYYNSSKDKIYIIKANNGNPEQISKLDTSEFSVISMFLLNDTLAVIGSQKNFSNDTLPEKHDLDKTHCNYYDITNKDNPKLRYSTNQDGFYVDSRAIADMVYIITKYYVYDDNDNYFIPECNNQKLNAELIYIPDHINSTSFTIITAFDSRSENNNFKSSLSILGGASTVYSGKENLYFTEYSPMKNDISGLVPASNTAIYRIALNNGTLTLNGSGCVPGNINNQFNIDENGDILRIATNIRFCKITDDVTVSFSNEDTVNRVFCLDKTLSIIGESDDLGKTEQIKSVRYIGDIAYVVTFRQTDPLYAVDLSDPENPKVLSELKIDGFSTYMHPYGENYIIGIGFDADPETGITTGLKITAFDFSDPAKVFDISSYIIKWYDGDNSGHYETEAVYDHKALLIDYKKGIIAIPLTKTTYVVETIFEEPYTYEEWTSHAKTSFIFLSFDGKTLRENSTIDISEYTGDYYHSNRNIRALYIGNYGYILDNEKVLSISLETMNIIAEIDFE